MSNYSDDDERAGMSSVEEFTTDLWIVSEQEGRGNTHVLTSLNDALGKYEDRSRVLAAYTIYLNWIDLFSHVAFCIVRTS